MRLVLYATILAGCVLRLCEVFRHNPIDNLFSDPLRHWTYARETLTTQPWAFIDPPLFQMWLSLVQKWSLGLPLLVALYAGLLSVITPWLWYRFLRETLGAGTLALAGWAALVWLPSWIAIFRYFMNETLFLPLMGASLWQTMRAQRRGTLASFSGMVALWTLTGLTRGIAIPLAGLAGLWVWMQKPDKLRNAVASLLVVLALTAPFAIRNHHFLNLWSPFGSGWPNQIYAESGAHDIHLHISNNGGSAYYEFGSPSLYTKPLAPLSDWETARTGIVDVSVDLGAGSKDWESASRATALHDLDLLRLRWENIVLVMYGPSWPDNNPDSLVASTAVATRFVWAPFSLLILIALVVCRRAALKEPLAPILIVAWFVFQAASLFVLNEGRYRKPLEGLLVVEALILLGTTRPSLRAL